MGLLTAQYTNVNVTSDDKGLIQCTPDVSFAGLLNQVGNYIDFYFNADVESSYGGTWEFYDSVISSENLLAISKESLVVSLWFVDTELTESQIENNMSKYDFNIKTISYVTQADRPIIPVYKVGGAFSGSNVVMSKITNVTSWFNAANISGNGSTRIACGSIQIIAPS